MSYHLFLDDERMPEQVTWIQLPAGPWEIARSYDEFVSIVESKGIPAFVSFDHDLAESAVGQNERKGVQCARWLCQKCIDERQPIPGFAIHSKNSVGEENIESVLRSAARVIASECNGESSPPPQST